MLSDASTPALIYKPASKAFEPHMGVYIEAQDKYALTAVP